jgi:hypothetical protein
MTIHVDVRLNGVVWCTGAALRVGNEPENHGDGLQWCSVGVTPLL